MAVVACIPFYNEAALIEFCLSSIDGLVDRIILIDGAWRRFPRWNGNRMSTDGTLEVIRRFNFTSKAEIYTGEGLPPWENSMHKRTRFFELCGPGDFLLYLDGNEVVAGGLPLDVKRLEEDRDAWKVKMWCFNEETPAWPVRLYRWLPGLHFSRNHWTVCDWKDEADRHPRHRPPPPQVPPRAPRRLPPQVQGGG